MLKLETQQTRDTAADEAWLPRTALRNWLLVRGLRFEERKPPSLRDDDDEDIF
jgi:hypothetical protein